MNIIRLADRLARLEQRRGPTPDPRRMAEVRQRLVAAVDEVTDLDEVLAARAEISAARARAGAR
jgi:hypothetical protein